MVSAASTLYAQSKGIISKRIIDRIGLSVFKGKGPHLPRFEMET